MSPNLFVLELSADTSPSSTRDQRATCAASRAFSSLTSSSRLPGARRVSTSLWGASLPTRRSSLTAGLTTTRPRWRCMCRRTPRSESTSGWIETVLVSLWLACCPLRSCTDASADKQKSKVSFAPQSLTLDLHLPNNKRVQKTVTLYGPIDPEKSRFRILGTKVDITLVKPVAASWPLLELPAAGTELPPGYALTFGVSGRTGTVGGKEVVLSVEEAAKQAAGK